jgi:hypothetical protein
MGTCCAGATCAQNTLPRVSAKFYKAFVQSILLNGSKTWVFSKTVLAQLEGFQQEKLVNLQATINSPSANQHNGTYTQNISSQENKINVNNNTSTDIQQHKLSCMVISEKLPSTSNDNGI